MRKNKMVGLGFAALGVLAAGTASAQSSATTAANANARVLAKITLVKVTDLNFGDLVASAALGTVVVDTAGVRSATGGVSLAVGLVSQASFTVTGEPNKTYTITAPAPVTISSGANTMTIDTFTLNPVTPATIPGAGTQTLNVGATLHVAANQATGTYGPQAFNVTVAYN